MHVFFIKTATESCGRWDRSSHLRWHLKPQLGIKVGSFMLKRKKLMFFSFRKEHLEVRYEEVAWEHRHNNWHSHKYHSSSKLQCRSNFGAMNIYISYLLIRSNHLWGEIWQPLCAISTPQQFYGSEGRGTHWTSKRNLGKQKQAITTHAGHPSMHTLVKNVAESLQDPNFESQENWPLYLHRVSVCLPAWRLVLYWLNGRGAIC